MARARWAVWIGLVTSAASLTGCKPSKETCDKFRTAAYEKMNAAQKCNSDAECKNSEWPGCAMPVSTHTVAEVEKIRKEYRDEKCEDAKQECRTPPEVYCKQGLCTYRYVDCGKMVAESRAKVAATHACVSHDDCMNSDWPECNRAVTDEVGNAVLRVFSEYRSNECKPPRAECPPSFGTACRDGFCKQLAEGETKDPPDAGDDAAAGAKKP